MKISACAVTDVGRKRSHNEDSYLVNDELGIYVVADGMGGHSGGELASQMAVRTIEEVLQGMSADPEATVISGVNTDEADSGDKLRYAIQMASSKIFDRALYDTALKGMGTTTVAVLFENDGAYVANVGDSRAYYFHANKMEQITTDHSLVSEQVRAGVIDKAEAKKHRFRNVITRSVGYQDVVEVDVKHIEVHMGDKFLMCSDGLSNMLDDKEMEEIVVRHPIKEACRLLVDRANEKGGDDNITALLVEVIDPK